jgi:hypothetical protein
MLPSPARKIVIISTITAFALVRPNYAQQSPADKLVTGVTLEKKPFLSVVMALAADTSVPIGVEVLAGEENREMDINATESKLGIELDKLVHADPRYEWKQMGKVINIFPKNGPKSVFDVLIDHFESKNALPIQMVQEIMREPAVATYLSKRRITPATWVTGSVPLERSSVIVQKATLREALDEILVATHRLGWVAFYRHEAGGDYLWFQLW